MKNIAKHQLEIAENGFTTIDNIYAEYEVENILDAIQDAMQATAKCNPSEPTFAIRQFLKEVPKSTEFIFNTPLQAIIQGLFGNSYFVTKSIYFNKPQQANWFVAYHQDLTIAVNQKIDLPNYTGWTRKQQRYAVQPPIEILENNFTIRIHLDDTDENNGALKVIPKSHLQKVYRPETIN
jgi:ectoine hydroxylase-related dioxygenase (phytanoyl-CoA dioxygenase family)